MISTELLSRYFDSSKPVGPIAAPPITADKDIQRFIFDHDNSLYRELNHGKTIIAGRKGSGKTSLLNSASFNSEKGSIVISLDSTDSADVFIRIIEEIEGLSTEITLVEQVSKLWEVLIWGVLFKYIYLENKDEILGKYIEGLSIRDFDGAPYELIDKQIEIMKTFPPTARPIPQKVRYTRINGLTFLEVKSYAISLLKQKKRYAFLLMDSLEDYKLHRHENSAAISGLLRCIGDFTAENSPCIFRCCVPAEKYHVLMSMSQNPLKDFAGTLLLHWDAGELVQLSAKRYATYLEHFEADYYRNEISALDFSKRDDAFLFWDKIFPREIVNHNGVTERPIAYILRHTQLLPRQMLVILTNVLSQSIKVRGKFTKISEQDIVDGVYQSEYSIKSQILEAYRSTGRDVESACFQILKELKTQFEWSDFDRVVATRSDDLKTFGRGEIMDMLIEIGAIGRLVGQTDRYFIANFEYMVPHRLVISHRDSFCVHPLFTETYNVQSKYAGAKPVYTYWSGDIPAELA